MAVEEREGAMVSQELGVLCGVCAVTAMICAALLMWGQAAYEAQRWDTPLELTLPAQLVPPPEHIVIAPRAPVWSWRAVGAHTSKLLGEEQLWEQAEQQRLRTTHRLKTRLLEPGRQRQGCGCALVQEQHPTQTYWGAAQWGAMLWRLIAFVSGVPAGLDPDEEPVPRYSAPEEPRGFGMAAVGTSGRGGRTRSGLREGADRVCDVKSSEERRLRSALEQACAPAHPVRFNAIVRGRRVELVLRPGFGHDAATRSCLRRELRRLARLSSAKLCAPS